MGIIENRDNKFHLAFAKWEIYTNNRQLPDLITLLYIILLIPWLIFLYFIIGSIVVLQICLEELFKTITSIFNKELREKCRKELKEKNNNS